MVYKRGLHYMVNMEKVFVAHHCRGFEDYIDIMTLTKDISDLGYIVYKPPIESNPIAGEYASKSEWLYTTNTDELINSDVVVINYIGDVMVTLIIGMLTGLKLSGGVVPDVYIYTSEPPTDGYHELVKSCIVEQFEQFNSKEELMIRLNNRTSESV